MKLGTKILVSLVVFAISYGLLVLSMRLIESPTEESADTVVVTRVIDGDTIEMEDGSVVRLAGIDTPERGECGFDEAAERLEDLVLSKPVELTKAGATDTDRYGRLIRYVDFVKSKDDGVVFTDDAGFVLIDEGLAVARYDSRDGYDEHPRQDLYVLTDAAVDPSVTC